MKKRTMIIIILMVMVLFVETLSCSGFSKASLTLQKIKDKSIFNNIVANAKKIWKGDSDMIIYEVNRQAEAVLEFSKLVSDSSYDEATMRRVVETWESDWVMIVYDYKRQNEARLLLLGTGK